MEDFLWNTILGLSIVIENMSWLIFLLAMLVATFSIGLGILLAFWLD